MKYNSNYLKAHITLHLHIYISTLGSLHRKCTKYANIQNYKERWRIIIIRKNIKYKNLWQSNFYFYLSSNTLGKINILIIFHS